MIILTSIDFAFFWIIQCGTIQYNLFSTWLLLFKVIFVSSSPACQRGQWYPTPVLLPGKSHGRRSLVGCSPWGRWESDMTERLHFHFSLSCIGEGNGNSSVLAWRIPGTGEPGRLSSMGSHRVGHDWSDLGAAAAAALLVRSYHSFSVLCSIPFCQYTTTDLSIPSLMDVGLFPVWGYYYECVFWTCLYEPVFWWAYVCSISGKVIRNGPAGHRVSHILL